MYVPSKFYALLVLKISGTEATLNLSSQNYDHLSSVIKPCLMQLLHNTPLKPISKACKEKIIFKYYTSIHFNCYFKSDQLCIKGKETSVMK